MGYHDDESQPERNYLSPALDCSPVLRISNPLEKFSYSEYELSDIVDFEFELKIGRFKYFNEWWLTGDGVEWNLIL